MTKSELFDIINDFEDLYAWCYDNGYEYLIEDLYREDEMNDIINDDIIEIMRWGGWQAVYDSLYDMPSTGYDFYIRTGENPNDWTPVFAEDFDDYFGRLCDTLEDDDFFEDEIQYDDEDEEESIIQTDVLFSLLRA